MRTLCDVCESAAAVLFCAADEAALCGSCDEKVHLCNKLASRHVRVGLADPSDVPRCDICDNAPAFFYCEIDGSSLCLQCDMIVHVGGKRTHGRYLLLRQRVEFPGDKPGRLEDLGQQPLDQNEMRRDQSQQPRLTARDNQQNHRVSLVPMLENNTDGDGKVETNLIDLNARPQRIHGQNSTTQEHGMDVMDGSNHEYPSMGPAGSFTREPEKWPIAATGEALHHDRVEVVFPIDLEVVFLMVVTEFVINGVLLTKCAGSAVTNVAWGFWFSLLCISRWRQVQSLGISKSDAYSFIATQEKSLVAKVFSGDPLFLFPIHLINAEAQVITEQGIPSYKQQISTRCLSQSVVANIPRKRFLCVLDN